MCFSTPKVPEVSASPRREGVGVDPRMRAANASGLYGNIFTSALGDSGYGKSVKSKAVIGN